MPLNGKSRLALTLGVALAISLFAFALGAGVHPASAAVGDTATVTTGKINVRSGPGPGYPSIATLNLGAEVTMLGRNSDSSWIKVMLADGITEGWLSTFYIQASSPVAELPVLANALPWGLVTAPVLNVRTGPGLNFGVMTTVGQGTFLTVLGRDSTSAWLKVLVGGAEGWAGRAFIVLSVPITSLPFAAAPAATATPAATEGGEAPTATATPAEGSETPDGVGGGEAPAEEDDTPTAVVNTGELNVRSGAGPGYPVVTKVFMGDVLKLEARNSVSSWVYVTVPDGKKGWVSTLYITGATVPVESLPVTADFTPTGWITAGAANLRTGPSLTSEVIATLNQNTVVGVLGRSADSGWVKVSASGVVGWVGSATIAMNVPFLSLPILAE